MRCALLIAFLASPVVAETCPNPPDHSTALASLFEAARSAEDQMAGQALSQQMWQLWLDAPDETAQEALDRGMRQRASFDFVGALDSFDTLIAYCPDYAEGYNQRAFVHFLASNFDKALTDLDKALALSPNHVGAQSGRALTLMNQGKTVEARLQLMEALENNPWLSERSLLAKGAPLGPQGQDL